MWFEQGYSTSGKNLNVDVTFTPTNSNSFLNRWSFFPKKKLSDARIFAEYVREIHRIPTTPSEWKKLNVVNVLYRWNGQGYYEPYAFDFKDDSSYEGRKVYD